ncbi:MobF family relaxase [Isoptericola sp. NPDC056573]|uniref:MobF family relaxase n=1 Tax=Isoptericola sp. NPDC056573 TaxID=3345868 RepID=UPI003673CB98
MSHGGIQKIGRGNGGLHSTARDFARYLVDGCEGLDPYPRTDYPIGPEPDAVAYANYASDGAPTVDHLTVRPGMPTFGQQITTPQLEAMLSWQGVDGSGEHGIPRSNSTLALDKAFNVSKELSILAGLDERFADVLEDAMHDAVRTAMEALAAESVSRIGPAGAQVLVPVTWMEAAVAMHRTSRAGDPHWHAHTVMPTRVLVSVRGEERWAGLWTTPLFRDQRRLNRIFDAALMGSPRLRRALLERGADVRAGTVVGVEDRVVSEFSRRRTQIDTATAAVAAAWQEQHPGETPTARVVARWREQAQKQTRAEKDLSKSLPQLRAEWLARARHLGWTGVHANSASEFRVESQIDPHEVARHVVDRLGAERSRWHDGDVQAMVFDEIASADLVVRDPARLRSLGRQIADLVISEYCLPLLDGTGPMDQARRSRVRAWTSAEVVRQELELRERFEARAHADADVDNAWLHAVGTMACRPLDTGQLIAAARIAGPESLVVVEGAAGSGKTAMLDAAIRATSAEGAKALILAPSATAAKVAGDEAGTTAATLHSFLRAHGYEWSDTEPLHRVPPAQRPVPGPRSRSWLADGDVVIVDEAGMADQDTVRAVMTIVDETPGVRVRLVGDRAQLASVGKGGVLPMAADVVPVTDLTDVHRFGVPGWAALSMLIRDRDPRSFDGLLRCGAFVASQDADVTAARFAHDLGTDLLAGRDALGIVATNEQAAIANAYVQAILRTAGQVTAPPNSAVPGRDGLTAGVGDRIATRANDGDLGVLNRQTWTVTGHGRGGIVRVRGEDGRRRSIPAGYVRRNTHLAYATTGYGAQGRTVDVARLLADASSAPVAYVGATRGRDANLIYLTAEDADEARRAWTTILTSDDSDDGITLEMRKSQRELDALGLRRRSPVNPPRPAPHSPIPHRTRRRDRPRLER